MRFEIETGICEGAKMCFGIETGPSRVIYSSNYLRENIVMVQYSPFIYTENNVMMRGSPFIYRENVSMLRYFPRL